MSDTKDGGPAFPRALSLIPSNGEIVWDQQGMTLRDYFAGKALQGLLAARKDIGWGGPIDIAKRCGEFADAMLAERDREHV